VCDLPDDDNSPRVLETPPPCEVLTFIVEPTPSICNKSHTTVQNFPVSAKIQVFDEETKFTNPAVCPPTCLPANVSELQINSHTEPNLSHDEVPCFTIPYGPGARDLYEDDEYDSLTYSNNKNMCDSHPSYFEPDRHVHNYTLMSSRSTPYVKITRPFASRTSMEYVNHHQDARALDATGTQNTSLENYGDKVHKISGSIVKNLEVHESDNGNRRIVSKAACCSSSAIQSSRQSNSVHSKYLGEFPGHLLKIFN
jgi:hypothetical protein